MPPLPESAQADHSATTTRCPNCAEPLEADDRFCGSCGQDLTAPVAASAPEGPTADGSAPAATSSTRSVTTVPAAAGHAADGRAATGQAPDGRADDGSGPSEGSVPDGGDAGHAGDGGDLEEPATDAFLLAPPLPPPGDGDGDGDTLVLSVPLPPARAGEPGREPAAAGPVCVACGLGGVDADGYCEHCGHAQPRQRDHQEQELPGVAAVSDRGLRHHRNEDAFAVAVTALPDGTPAVAAVVCDGVSTAFRPDDASAAASVAGRASLVAALERGAPTEEAMHDALMAAFEAVGALAEEESSQANPHHNAPACTCVSAVVTGPVFTVGWIGDSRAYWVPDDRALPASRLTEDDSWAARMVAAGLMTEAEAYADERAHAITGWLGADAVEVDPHVAAFQPEGPGVVVVCTDGLWNYAESAAEMADAVPADARARPLHSARTLLGVALDGGGHDNVTVAVLPFPAAVARAGFPPA